jgi:2-dehydropantoate 2-reductase
MITIIGNGNLATHLAHYFTLVKLPWQQWSRKTHALAVLKRYCLTSHTLIVAIKDDAIPSFIEDHLAPLPTCTIIHCSAVHSIPGTFCVHPLASFGPLLYDLPTYTTIPLIVDMNQQKHLQSKISVHLSNPIYAIDPKQRPLYHALCCIAGNFSTLLWQYTLHHSQQHLNLNAEVFHPYLATLSKQLRHQPQTALTGPLVRQDEVTLAQHLETLKQEPMLPLYQAFITFFKATTKEPST